MRKAKVIIVLAVLTAIGGLVRWTQITVAQYTPHFNAVVLGCEGGLQESNLSAYLIAKAGTTEFACLDAGTILSGLHVAVKRKAFKSVVVAPESNLTVAGWVLNDRIKCYLISHAHLDHIAGLIINSTDDTAKPLLGLNQTITYLRDNIFNWKVWPNFGSEGPNPLKQYTYERLEQRVSVPVPGTEMTVEPFLLSHAHPYPSTAFLLESDGFYLLYCGDTGPDEVERNNNLSALWQRVAPLVREGKLRGIFLEVSFPDGRPDGQLFGHLTPKWMIAELSYLANLVSDKHPERALRGLKVVVTHIKPGLEKGPTPRERIQAELKQQNTLGVNFLFPKQGDLLKF